MARGLSRVTVEVPLNNSGGTQSCDNEGLPRIASFLPKDFNIEDFSDIRTLPEVLLKGCKRSISGPYLGQREKKTNGELGEYIWQSYSQVIQRSTNIGRILFACNLKAVGLYCINCPDWNIIAQAAFCFGIAVVPLYDTLGHEATMFVVGQTELSTIFCSADKVAYLLQNSALMPLLARIIIINSDDPIQPDIVKSARQAGVSVSLLCSLEKFGSGSPVSAPVISGDTTALICYTSGTTGLPKGAILSHFNIIATVFGFAAMSKHNMFLSISNTDVHLSYLPLAHIFELSTHTLCAYFGCRIGYYSGDTQRLFEDAVVLKPTVFVSVPRVFNKLHDRVWQGVRSKGGWTKFVFELAYTRKLGALRKGHGNKSVIWDSLVFKKIRMLLGGRVRMFFSGSAPLAQHVYEFLNVCFSCSLIEGYGQTETSAGISATLLSDYTSGHVGVPLPGVQIKLTDLPDLGYTASSDGLKGRGQICVRGPQVFQAYFRDPARTQQALDKDGWLSTGDVGQWDKYGRLVIIDRVKNMFKLAQGEFVSPELIENVYLSHYLVQSVFIYGDPLRSNVVGIIRIDAEAFRDWSSKTGTRNQTYVGMATLELLGELNLFARKAGLKGYQTIAAAHLLDHDFAMVLENRTPTWKVRRNVIISKYADIIESLYDSIK